MIKPPTEKRNLSLEGLANERLNINMLNDVLGDIELTPAEERTLIWLCGWETSTVQQIVSVFEKVRLRQNTEVR
jgi:hypothetical protein